MRATIIGSLSNRLKDKEQSQLKTVTKRYPTTVAYAIGEYGIKRTKIKDAVKPLKFNVIQSDCSLASRRDPSRCAFVRALERNEGGHGDVDIKVIRSVAILIYKRPRLQAVRYELDKGTRAALQTFDRTGTMEPGTYTLGPVAKTNRLENRHLRGTARGPHKTTNPHRTRPLPGIRLGIEVKKPVTA